MMSNVGHLVRGLLVAAILSVSVIAGAGETAISGMRSLTQKESVGTASPMVCLSDVFEEFWVESRCPRGQVECCPWKVESTTRRLTISRDEAARAVTAAKLLLDSAAIKGGDQTVATQTHRMITGAEVRAKAEEKMQSTDVEGKWVVSDARINGTVNIPYDAEWDLALPTTLTKQSSVKIIYNNGSGEALAGWAQIVVAHYRTALVAKHDLISGTTLKPEDFKTQQIDVLSAAANSDGPISIATFDGTVPLRVRMSLRSGAVLTNAAVEKSPAVILGDAVTLVLRSENLKIMTKGTAQGSGALGDTVSVQLRSYNRTFRGKVSEGKQVEVWL